MCGIFLAIPKSSKQLDLEACNKALNYLKKRGPDWHFNKVINNKFFGQTVLSMTGDKRFNIQNHFSENKRFITLFNGEIYNHKELGKKKFQQKNFSDTFALVNSYNPSKIESLFNTLDGMFAVVIYDILKDKLIIARDMQGEKSLYIYEDKKIIIVSSEINAIKIYIKNLKIDNYWLQTYLNSRHFLQLENTIYENITIVQPGQIFEVNKYNKIIHLNKIEIHHLVSENIYNYNSKRSEDDLIEELEYIFRKNIKQMVPHDRPFCSILSGGVDSTLVSYYLSEISSPKKYFSLDHLGKDKISNKIKKFQKYFNSEIKSLKINENFYYKNLIKSLQICSSPINSHDFPGKLILAEAAKKIKTKAIFGGDGADELFGGYETYIQSIKDPQINYSNYTKFINSKIRFSDKKDIFEKKLKKKWEKCLKSYDFIKNKEDKNRLSMMLNDSSNQLSSVGLRGCDLMFMNHSIESRSLFLRRDVIKFALNLPLKFKINTNKANKFKTKIILKKIFFKYFPKNLLFKKQGFSGFPNETKKKLGDFKNFKLNNLLFKTKKLNQKKLDKSLEWKIYNLEHFLRLNLNEKK